MIRHRNTAIKAILLDLDGVLYVGDQLIRGAPEAVAALREQGMALAGVTNTTTRPRRAIGEKLKTMHIPIHEDELFTPAALTVQTIGHASACLFVRESVKEDFEGVKENDSRPDYVVMGDVGGEGYSPEMLRRIFTMVMDGARLLALHKNRFWQKPDGLHLDLGPFVAAIEYATGCEATVLGKPSQAFFHGICSKLNVAPEESLMVGDDIESDIGGAQQAGLKTALVQTGKYREEFVRKTGIRADLVLPSIADLPDALHLL